MYKKGLNLVKNLTDFHIHLFIHPLKYIFFVHSRLNLKNISLNFGGG